MDFDRFSIVLLVLRPDAPRLDEEAAGELQDAHLAYLVDLHDDGRLLAAGPLADERVRGLLILTVDADRARELAERDPAVKGGRFSAEVIPWRVPAGAIAWAPARFPRSRAEAGG
jgi:uncharacterized protein YciI